MEKDGQYWQGFDIIEDIRMNTLLISRKGAAGFGGLSRFYAELSAALPTSAYTLDPSHAYRLFGLPFVKFDLIYLCDATLLPLGMILKMVLRKPVVVTAHGLDVTFPNRLYQFVLQTMLPFADSVVVVSASVLTLIEKFNISKHRKYLIYSGISTDYFKHNRKIQIPDMKDKTALLTVGNLILRKGHEWFIREVFVKLPNDFVYYIVGDGPLKSKVQNLINQLKLSDRVFLLGQLTDQELAYVFKKSHIYVCPNQKVEGDFEGFGMACGEAAALGLPVVASNVDGIPEVIKDHRNGLLVKPTPDMFITTINRLKNQQLRRSLVRKAKTYTQKNYRWNDAARKYLMIFQEVAHKNESSS